MTSSINQLRLNILEYNSPLFQNTKNNNRISELISEENSDTNTDKVFSYDEYMKYCEENAVSQYSENPGKTIVQRYEDTSAQIQSIRPINIGKALTIYSHSEQASLEASVESEA